MTAYEKFKELQWQMEVAAAEICKHNSKVYLYNVDPHNGRERIPFVDYRPSINVSFEVPFRNSKTGKVCRKYESKTVKGYDVDNILRRINVSRKLLDRLAIDWLSYRLFAEVARKLCSQGKLSNDKFDKPYIAPLDKAYRVYLGR